MKRLRRLLLSVWLILTLFAAGCIPDLVATQPPTADEPEVVIDTGTPTRTPAPTNTHAPTATPTSTPSPTPTLNATDLAFAACLAEIAALTECVNQAVIPIIYTDGAPNHQIANNGDPTTLYRSPDILEMLNAPGVTMVHNYFARPDTCPLGTACVLHLLMIEFPSQGDALAFFERVTQIGMEGETVLPAAEADDWDALKVATGMRASTAAGAPPFAVAYGSGSLGALHWGFNLSAYETLPEGFLENDLGSILGTAHEYLSAWQRAGGDAPVRIRWFTGLGSGAQAAADSFSLSQPGIELSVDVFASTAFREAMAGAIAAGDAPDIVGPISVSHTLAFDDQWLDLQPLINSTGYDLSQYSGELVEFYRTSDGSQIGLPFAVFPPALYFNRDLFDEAGLNYPPQSYGEPYSLPDGTEAEWTFDTLREVALLLTVDENGNSAADPDFDPANIIQYGYAPQNQDLRAMGSYFGAASLVAPDGATVAIPAQWNDAWRWVYDGIWTDRFIPNQAALDSAALGSGNPFNSGKVAMALTTLDYLCCLAGAGNWDLAAVPSHKGQTTANLDADTFHILKSTQNPAAAFEVLSYLLGEAAPALLEINGGMPARTADQAGFVGGLNAQFPQGVNWQAAIDSVAFADNPSYQGYLPNYDAANRRLDLFLGELFATPGLDLNAEIAALEDDLQAVFAHE